MLGGLNEVTLCLLPSNSDGVPGKVSSPFRTTAPPTVKSLKVQQGSLLDKSDPKTGEKLAYSFNRNTCHMLNRANYKNWYCDCNRWLVLLCNTHKGFPLWAFKSCTPCSSSVASLHLSNDLCTLHWHVVLVLLLLSCVTVLGLVPNVGVWIQT